MKDLKTFNSNIDQFNENVTYILRKLHEMFGIDEHLDLVATDTPLFYNTYMTYYLRSASSDVEKTYASLINVLKSNNISVKLDSVKDLQDIYANVEKIKDHMNLY